MAFRPDLYSTPATDRSDRSPTAGGDESTCEAPAVYEVMTAEGWLQFGQEEYFARRRALAGRMDRAIATGINHANAGRQTHDYHMSEVRGVIGFLSDFVNDVHPPWIGMWSACVRQFERARVHVENDELVEAQRWLLGGYRSLGQAQADWSKYIDATIAGAEATASTLAVIRDGAIAVELGLLTGGTFYVAAGGGALAASGATVAGTGGLTAAAAIGGGDLGDAARGTLGAMVDAGIYDNLRLAAHGLAGMVLGIGEAFTAMAEGLAGLFTDPAKFVEDIARLPEAIGLLFENRRTLFEAFARLPDDAQAHQVGRLAGHVQAMLMSIEAAKAASAAMAGTELSVTAPVWGAGTGGAASLELATVRLATISREVAVVAAAGPTAAGALHMMSSSLGEDGSRESKIQPDGSHAASKGEKHEIAGNERSRGEWRRGQYHGPKPAYANPGHHDPTSGRFRGRRSQTSVLPKDAEDVYRHAIPDKNGVHWYGRSADGEIYIYRNGNYGTVHWAGSTATDRGVQVPRSVRERFRSLDGDRDKG